MAEVEGPREAGAETLQAMLGDLALRAQLSTPDHLAKLVAQQAGAVGILDVVVYLVDYGQTRLVPLPYGVKGAISGFRGRRCGSAGRCRRDDGMARASSHARSASVGYSPPQRAGGLFGCGGQLVDGAMSRCCCASRFRPRAGTRG